MTTRKTHSPRRFASGMSLVELMIAMTLGLVTVAAIGWIYFGTSKTYRTQDAVARLQEGARYAFEVISNDLRMSGSLACGYSTNHNAIANYQNNWYTNFVELPLSAAEQGSGPAEATSSDALRILRTDVSKEFIVSAHDGTGAFTTSAAHGLSTGALLLATDCQHAAIFQAAAGTTGSSIVHSSLLGAGGASKTYAVNSRIYRLSATTYYVAANPAGVPSLYRLRPQGPTATPVAEEIVEGVEDLQVTFGVDTDATPDREANLVNATAPYLTAATINGAGSGIPGGAVSDRWARVVSVRISLLMRTVEDRVVPSEQTYNYNGATVNATDLRLRRVFTHVVKVRNR